MFQRELQRFNRVVEADQANRRADLSRFTQHCQCIRRRAEADIPDNELARMSLQSLRELELSHIQCFGLRYGPNDRMKRLLMRQGMDAVNAAGEFDEFVAGAR